MVKYKAEYIWIDGSQPTAKLRSKTKILTVGTEPPVWGFDGSSTNQAPGSSSDCVLNPVFVCPDPIRGEEHKLVLCEVLNLDMSPHATNARRACIEAAERFADHGSLFGIEQEYTFFQGNRPLGWPETGFPAPQGGYYCGVGADEIFGRDIVEDHTDACIAAGLAIAGINAEVMIGQWEYQIGPLGPVETSDQIWVSRWLLYRIAEDYNVTATLNPKPVQGDWNGAGAHTNFSTREMRESYDAIIKACEALGAKRELHMESYGAGIKDRLTGEHETQRWDEFSFGDSDRGASIRIPWHCVVDRKGYLEDRRPNANMDPYLVTRLMVETCCGAFE